jgi:hypothetical protein
MEAENYSFARGEDQFHDISRRRVFSSCRTEKRSQRLAAQDVPAVRIYLQTATARVLFLCDNLNGVLYQTSQCLFPTKILANGNLGLCFSVVVVLLLVLCLNCVICF